MGCVGKPLSLENVTAAASPELLAEPQPPGMPLPPPSSTADRRCCLELTTGLLPNQFGDRRCFGSTVPFFSSWLGTEVLAARILIVDLGSRRKEFYDAFGLWFYVLR
ncbi:uncharacterized protein DS421_4g123560 [Arachis hypogaea]|nr:uncharacterized protein DS421_4g123560 [Arachis hypogaea]